SPPTPASGCAVRLAPAAVDAGGRDGRPRGLGRPALGGGRATSQPRRLPTARGGRAWRLPGQVPRRAAGVSGRRDGPRQYPCCPSGRRPLVVVFSRSQGGIPCRRPSSLTSSTRPIV